MPYTIKKQDETLAKFAKHFGAFIATAEGRSIFLKELEHVHQMRADVAAKERPRLAV